MPLIYEDSTVCANFAYLFLLLFISFKKYVQKYGKYGKQCQISEVTKCNYPTTVSQQWDPSLLHIQFFSRPKSLNSKIPWLLNVGDSVTLTWSQSRYTNRWLLMQAYSVIKRKQIYFVLTLLLFVISSIGIDRSTTRQCSLYIAVEQAVYATDVPVEVFGFIYCTWPFDGPRHHLPVQIIQMSFTILGLAQKKFHS